MLTLVCSLEQAGEDVQYHWDPMARMQLCPVETPFLVSHGHLVTVAAIAALPRILSARAPALFMPASSAQVEPSFCVSLISGHPWSIDPWPAFFSDLEAVEGRRGHWFAVGGLSKVAGDAPSALQLCPPVVAWDASTCPDPAGLLQF